MFKRYVIITLLFMGFLSGCTSMTQIPNPWTDCSMNLEQAYKIAGFKFPLALSNYTVRAMKDMIEITYPLDEFRTVCVRKSMKEGNISGDYTVYPVNETKILCGGVPVNIRGDGEKIYVMSFSASNGYYSARCEKGMNLNEVEGIIQVISEAEAPKNIP